MGGIGEIALWLRACTVLVKDPSLIPSVYTGWSPTQFQEICCLLLLSTGTAFMCKCPYAHTYPHAYTQTHTYSFCLTSW